MHPRTEPTVQQEETPQPPPPNPPDGIGEENPESEEDEQQNEDMTFFTCLEEHFGHPVSFSFVVTVCKSENFSLHALHIYS
jgi:hypothetical protein